MSDRYLELRRESGHIPSGRQLPRTPPSTEVTRYLDFSNEDPEETSETLGSRGPEEPELSRSIDLHMLEPRTELSGHAMLKGMKGYQLTPSDLEFIRTMQEDKQLRTLQRDLEEVKKLLKTETVAAEKSLALRERLQADLDKLPSCAKLAAWARAVLGETRPPANLDTKRLLSMVKKEDVQRLVKEKEALLVRLEEMVEDKKKKEAEEREKREKEIAEGQLKVRGLMREFSNLKSELEREEEVQKMLQSRIKVKETAEIKVEIGERRDAKNQAKRGGKEGETAAGSEDGVERERPPRKRVVSAKSDKRSDANDANETSKTNPKTVKATRAAREPKREEEPVQRGWGKPPTAAPQPRRQVRKAAESSSSRGQTGAEAEEAAPNAGLRRSKRIANRK